MAKLKTKGLPDTEALEAVRRLMQSTGFDDEEAYGQRTDEVSFTTRDEGDVLEGRADPGMIRFARVKAKEIETAVPGTKARVEVVDEWVSIVVALPSAAKRKPLKVNDTVELSNGLGRTVIGMIVRLYNEGMSSESAEIHAKGYAPSFHPTRTLKKSRKRALKLSPSTSSPTPKSSSSTQLRPGDEVKYTLFTIGGSREATAIVTWDHGKSGVEARSLGGERFRLERAADGSLRRFT